MQTNGWRTLKHISPTTEFLNLDTHNPHNRQPETWNQQFQQRDGKDSGASVEMYIAKVTRTPGASQRSSTRAPYDVDPNRPETLKPFHDPYPAEAGVEASNADEVIDEDEIIDEDETTDENEAPHGHEDPEREQTHAEDEVYNSDESSEDFYPGSDVREVLVVAERGCQAKYIETGRKLDPDLRKLFRRRTWQEIKEQKLFAGFEEDPCAIV